MGQGLLSLVFGGWFLFFCFLFWDIFAAIVSIIFSREFGFLFGALGVFSSFFFFFSSLLFSR